MRFVLYLFFMFAAIWVIQESSDSHGVQYQSSTSDNSFPAEPQPESLEFSEMEIEKTDDDFSAENHWAIHSCITGWSHHFTHPYHLNCHVEIDLRPPRVS